MSYICRYLFFIQKIGVASLSEENQKLNEQILDLSKENENLIEQLSLANDELEFYKNSETSVTD